MTTAVIVDAAGLVTPGGPWRTRLRHARLTGPTAGQGARLAGSPVGVPTAATVQC